MARVPSLGFVIVLSAASLAAPLVAQTPAPAPAIGQVRDPVPATRETGSAEPGVRRIPVGTSSITGTVTAGDTGRPIKGARVMLAGSSVLGGVRGGGPVGAVVGGVAGPIPGGIPGGVAFGGGGVQTQLPVRGGAPGAPGFATGLARSILTDDSGQFSFQKLPAGQFTLSVNRNQFLSTSYGQRRPGGQGTSIVLTDGQQMKVSLTMMRGGVITGVVLGQDGEPQPSAQIRAWRYTMTNGFKRLQQVGGGSTDDRGAYRLFNLQPGDYIVSATPNPSDLMITERTMADMAAVEQAIASGTVQPPAVPGMPATVTVSVTPPQQQGPMDVPGYLPTYHPSTPMPSNASIVHLNGGEERIGIDVQVQLVQASNIQGTIATPTAQGVAVQVALLSDDPMNAGMSLPSTRVNQDGKFTFRSIAPGKYTVFAQTAVAPPPMTIVNGVPSPPTQGPPPQLDASQRLWGRSDVTVDGQSTVSVNIPLETGRSISGVVIFEMASPPDFSRTRSSVFLTPAPSLQSTSFGPTPQAQIEPDGRFTLSGVIPGKYTLRASTGPIKSAIIGGTDTLDFPLDLTGDRDITDAVLTITDKTTEVSGTLTDASGKPALDYTIIAAAAEDRFWTPGSRRILTTRTNTDGHYTFRTLPPGNYLIAVVTDLELGTQYDAEFLKSLLGASVRVSLGEGAKVQQDLRVR